MNYDVIQPNRVLRSYAREQLHGVWNKMAFIFFIYFLILLPVYICSFLIGYYSALNGINSALSGYYERSPWTSLNYFISLVLFVLSGPFTLGFASLFLKRIRGESFSLINLFDGFKRFGKSFLLMLLMTVFVFLWSLLFFIPGIVKSFSYSLAFFILYDNPDIKLRQALKESARLMKGYKGKLFGLYFSFIGWEILCLLTLGIGFFWLSPYIFTSFANFYENLKISNAQKNSDSTVIQ